jgi:intergrase/recombinase
MALRGVPMAVIAEALGQADERITRRHYAHLSKSYVADIVRNAVARLGIVERNNAERDNVVRLDETGCSTVGG